MTFYIEFNLENQIVIKKIHQIKKYMCTLIHYHIFIVHMCSKVKDVTLSF